MPDVNKANRTVCDVDIRILKTKSPFLFVDTANATTVGIEGASVFANAKGTKKIPFQDPLSGSLSLEFQVYPFKMFALMSNGEIENSAVYADVSKIMCETAGELSISVENGTVETGTVFVYPEDSYGDEDARIAGTFANGKFTATATDDLVKGTTYKIAYMVNRTGVKKISFNNKKLPKDYYITMSTVDKNEDDMWVPKRIVCHKAAIQRNFEMSFASEGDPMSITLNFDLLESKDGEFVDFVEIEDDAASAE